jgi:uncharacterized membrane protein
MTSRVFKVWQRVLAAVVAIAAATSIVIGNAFVLISAVIVGMVIIMVLRSRVAEVVVDERTYTIAYKAARVTLAAGSISMAVAGAVLLTFSHGDFSAPLARIGFALEYAVCGLLIINNIAYYYFSRKLGGKA